MPGIISDRDMAYMRNILVGANHNFMPDIVDIYRATHTTDSAGADVITYPDTPSVTVYGRIDQVSTRYRDEKERSSTDEITAIPEIIITVPYDTELHVDDHLVVNAAVYEVEREMSDSSWPGVNQVHCRRINEA